MISSLQIRGFRSFERFDMSGLGRINLLVGTNNSGKTSVLEALSLLTSAADPMAVWHMLWKRGERIVIPVLPNPDGTRRGLQTEIEVAHLFKGHEIHHGSKFVISARDQTSERSLAVSVVELSPKERLELLGLSDEDSPPVSRLALQFKGNPAPVSTILPLTRNCGLTSDVLDRPRRSQRRLDPPSVFITPESLGGSQLTSLWSNVSLKPAEYIVTQALRFIEPDIERIAIQANTEPFYGPSRGGFIVKLRGVEQPVPLGSMGDGMWRMLAMAISITQCSGGVLLIDEIDAGLHYSVMSSMWRLMFNTARDLSVQIFATTHSFDCIQSLASACAGEPESESSITVQRIETGNTKSIPYTESEIRVAADKLIEVR